MNLSAVSSNSESTVQVAGVERGEMPPIGVIRMGQTGQDDGLTHGTTFHKKVFGAHKNRTV